MASEHTRRRLVQVTGGALAALSGCAGAVGRLRPDGAETATDPSPAPQPEPTTTGAGAGETARSDSAETSPTSDTTPAEPATPTRSFDVTPPETPFDDVPLPESPGDHRFATMGHPDGAATARLFGNWKCPYTQAFVVEQLDDLVDRYVRPGGLAVQFRALAYRSGEPFLGPDAPRAARAGLGVWHADPASYWSYFGYVFGNQPPEREEWASTDYLLSLAGAAGVDALAEVELALAGDAYADAVRSTVEVTADLRVFTVPRIEVDGRVAAPTVDPESTRKLLDEAVAR